MSISSEISRLQGAKDSIKTSIENKGVTVPSSAKIDTYDDYIDQITTGGGTEEKDVTFYDWDGTVLYSYTLAEARALEALPALPTGPTGWTADSWSKSLSSIKSLTSKCDIGVNYAPPSTNYYVEIDGVIGDKKTLGIYREYSNLQVDWGDGTTETLTNPEGWYWHTYSNSGNYTLKITIQFGGYGNTYFRGYKMTDVDGTSVKASVMSAVAFPDETTGNASSKPYSSFIKRARIGKNINLDYLFIGSSLQHYIIPDTMNTIGQSMFQNSYDIEKIIIPDIISYFSNYCFDGCSSLKSITIPNSITTIKDSNFNNCYSLENITIPSTVTSIGTYAFGGCTSLQDITIPNIVTSIGANAFRGCVSLMKISIPNSVTSIGDAAFYGCSSLRDIDFPGNLTSIGGYLFQNCYSLKKVKMSNTVTSIGTYAFDYCQSLEDITLSSTLSTISNFAFRYCQSLRSIRIPSSITSIGNSVFSNCTWLYDVHIEKTTPPTLGTNVFNSNYSSLKIYVPYSEDHSILAAYQSATNWSNYASKMVEEPQS